MFDVPVKKAEIVSSAVIAKLKMKMKVQHNHLHLLSHPPFIDGSSVSQEMPFSILAHNVVLATGTHDIPARLGVEGESLPFVYHSFWELEAAISRGELDQASDPVLVVGAGLTAADAVLAAHHLNTPVCHVFRRSVTDPGLIFNQLPKLLYPEYHKVRIR